MRLFVYGTLKRGYWNHERFCQGVLSVEEASVIGRLYEFPSGIPILEVPPEHILAHGTSDPLADVATQERFSQHLAQHPHLIPEDPPTGDWARVSGELLTFDDPEIRLPAIDRLEGFTCQVSCSYYRYLIPIAVRYTSEPAWIYGIQSINDSRELRKVSGGAWTQ